MKFRFKVQAYQTEAVERVIRMFEGQPPASAAETLCSSDRDLLDLQYRGNCNAALALQDERLLENLHRIQREAHIRLSPVLERELGACSLDIQMETGTGKTYVYIKTIFELNRRYGWSKFIIVVPNVAIREGVMKSIRIMEDHFMGAEQYGKKLRAFLYDNNKLNRVVDFASDDAINVMVINVQKFNSDLGSDKLKSKAARIINRGQDSLGGQSIMDLISATRPILILDEPQRMEAANTRAGLRRFKPLFTLNYSATHVRERNKVYELDALDAYRQKLVKKIEVIGIELRNMTGSHAYMYLHEICTGPNRAPQAKLTYECKLRSGRITHRTRLLGHGDSLYAQSAELEAYKDYTIADISPAAGYVEFTNGERVSLNQASGDVTAEAKVRIQMRQTIDAHLRKEAQLFRRGIKVLSLFFLDDVCNYRRYAEDGSRLRAPYEEWFEEAYQEAVEAYQDMVEPEYGEYLRGIRAEETHNGYFSIDREGRATNGKQREGRESEDAGAYDLILRNKERLLSLEEPVRFIFSHSALREGWDNPNVFQICALRQSNSDVRRHQEVGRGMRLCVNQEGVRMDSEVLGDAVHDINLLTVIASEGYAEYVSSLLEEMKASFHERILAVSADLFTGLRPKTDSGFLPELSKPMAGEAFFQLRLSGHIDKNGQPTPAFLAAFAQGSLAPLPDELEPYSAAIYKLVAGVADSREALDMVARAAAVRVSGNTLTENFYSREFQELWKRINHKCSYTVSFRSEELVEKAVGVINAKLTVPALAYTVERGVQREEGQGGAEAGEQFTRVASETKWLGTPRTGRGRYDLVGKVAKGAMLTRRTAATILHRLNAEKFALFRSNPEAFIAQVTRLILEQKATMIVESISYHPLEERFESDIFTSEHHSDFSRAVRVNKCVVPYVFTDGVSKDESIERRFLRDLEDSTHVAVYAKLPKDGKAYAIPTPVGNYSPDWAIAFRQGAVQHVFFVAETKGSLSSMQLRKIEECKTECARRLFESLCHEEVKYSVVDSLDALLSLAGGSGTAE